MKLGCCSASPTCVPATRPEAAKAFGTVNKDPTMARIAKLWLLKTA